MGANKRAAIFWLLSRALVARPEVSNITPNLVASVLDQVCSHPAHLGALLQLCLIAGLSPNRICIPGAPS